MQISKYRIILPNLRAASMRIVQVSDVHFSAHTGQEKNRALIQALGSMMQQLRPDLIAVTGDLVSRKPGDTGISDAGECMEMLHRFAPVLYTFGNHEVDLPAEEISALLGCMDKAGVTMLNNRMVNFGSVDFSGYVLPYSCYKNEMGGYWGLSECSCDEMQHAIGCRRQYPTILLAHSPMGLPAYAQWGADVVLSGHVHGGIVRMPLIGGVLSPERRFFPKYTKGRYDLGNTAMIVSAGIGKFRVGNPPEIVCIDIAGR